MYFLCKYALLVVNIPADFLTTFFVSIGVGSIYSMYYFTILVKSSKLFNSFKVIIIMFSYLGESTFFKSMCIPFFFTFSRIFGVYFYYLCFVFSRFRSIIQNVANTLSVGDNFLPKFLVIIVMIYFYCTKSVLIPRT